MKHRSELTGALPATLTTLHLLKLRLLKLLLGFGTLAIIGTWIFERSSGRINQADQIAYPIMITLFMSYFMTIQLRPATLAIMEQISFATFAIYIIMNSQMLIYGLQPNIDLYTLATFAQWFPLVYTAAFIFLETRHAVIISAVIYLSLLMPSVLNSFANNMQFGSADTYAVLLSMNFSHPVYIVVLSGIAQLKEHFVRIKAHADIMSVAASIDHLTATANRRSLAQTLQQALAQLQPSECQLAVLLLDIDNFKQVNDRFGHDVGDQILVDIASFLRQQLRGSDTLGRWGGEEFMIVVTETKPAATVQLAERLRALIAERRLPPVGQVTLSFGVAIAHPGDSADSLVKRADEALYRAKQSGRNRVEVATPFASG